MAIFKQMDYKIIIINKNLPHWIIVIKKLTHMKHLAQYLEYVLIKC